jgi:hypothetical protein
MLTWRNRTPFSRPYSEGQLRPLTFYPSLCSPSFSLDIFTSRSIGVQCEHSTLVLINVLFRFLLRPHFSISACSYLSRSPSSSLSCSFPLFIFLPLTVYLPFFFSFSDIQVSNRPDFCSTLHRVLNYKIVQCFFDSMLLKIHSTLLSWNGLTCPLIDKNVNAGKFLFISFLLVVIDKFPLTAQAGKSTRSAVCNWQEYPFWCSQTVSSPKKNTASKDH